MDYQNYFEEWKNWEKFEEEFNGINGVYAFRLKSSFGRLRGASSVLYIGKCDQNPETNRHSGLWHRLKNYRQNNAGGSKRLKEIENEFGGRSNVEYSYVVCGNPREIEKALLEDYYMKHSELPPLNRACQVFS
ncbi:MAG: hypothetical protein NTU69_12320 [Proteobacteria bacterium]|nr:hypothetical protein [Pseudomonadota bacterium]